MLDLLSCKFPLYALDDVSQQSAVKIIAYRGKKILVWLRLHTSFIPVREVVSAYKDHHIF